MWPEGDVNAVVVVADPASEVASSVGDRGTPCMLARGDPGSVRWIRRTAAAARRLAQVVPPMHVDMTEARHSKRSAVGSGDYLLPRYTTLDGVSRLGVRLSRLRRGTPLGARGVPNPIADAIANARAQYWSADWRCSLPKRLGGARYEDICTANSCNNLVSTASAKLRQLCSVGASGQSTAGWNATQSAATAAKVVSRCLPGHFAAKIATA